MSNGATTRAYVTLNRVVQQMELDRAAIDSVTNVELLIDAQNATVRNALKDYIYEVSDELFNDKSRDFVPYDSTLTIRRNQLRVFQDSDFYILDLSHLYNRDLLAVDSLTINGTLISASDYDLDTSYGYPVTQILLNRQNVDNPYDTIDGFTDSVVIVGTWGYNEHPSAMWAVSGDTVQDSPLSASATSVTVTDADNFETFQYIKIADEYLFITSLDTATNILTVERGVNGTTASEHANGVTISTYKQNRSVEKEVARHVIRAYQLRNTMEAFVVGTNVVEEVTQGDFMLKIPARWSLGSVS